MHVPNTLHILLYSKTQKNQVFFSSLGLFFYNLIVLCYDITRDLQHNYQINVCNESKKCAQVMTYTEVTVIRKSDSQ